MREELDELIPVRKHMSTIRVPILQKAAEWKTVPPLRQARNGLAHGGHILTDVHVIMREKDPAEKDKLKRGFESIYHLKFDDHESFTKYNAVVNLANIHANILTLDEFKSRDADAETCKKLLDSYGSWADAGEHLETYPFTTEKVSSYHKLIRLYDRSLPQKPPTIAISLF